MGSKWRKAKLALGLNFNLNLRYFAPHDDAPLLSHPPPSTPSSSQNICSICLAALTPGEGHAIFTAECSHSFHLHCITSNVKHGNQICPVCRSEWKEIPFHSPIPPGGGAVPNLVTMPQNNTRPSRPVSPLFQVTEPAVFNDDECLGQSDNSEKTTSNPSAASNNPVKSIDIKTFPQVSCVQRNQCLDNFTVLIHLKAAVSDVLQDSGTNQEYVPLISRSSRTPVDLVTVLDISGSMAGTKLALLKRAMGFVIQNLSSNDRLSVIAFSSTARRLFPLLQMSESGRQQALRAVNSLMASGGTNIAEGLRKGAKVMEGRREKNPVASIILLSDGRDTYTGYNYGSGGNQMKPNHQLLFPLFFQGNDRSGFQIPVHTFGFGTDHDAASMHSISEGSGGTFSFIETEAAIQDAFAQCIGGLLSVVVQELQVGVECIHPNTCLVSIKSGSYLSRMMDDGKVGSIDVGDIYADEERDFLVSLNIPPETSGNSMLLLKVRCVFKNPITKETVTLEGEEVKIGRPETVQEEEVVSIEVDRQRNRLRAAEAMGQARTAAEQGDLGSAVSVLENCRNLLASSVSAKSQDRLCVALDAELKEMQERMASRHMYEASGRAYILSGLSSHSWQRATARGDSTDSSSTVQAYQTPSMTEMLTRSKATSLGSPTGQRPVRPIWSFPSPKPR